MTDFLMTVNNEKIWRFFKERNPGLQFEDCITLFIDLIERLTENMNASLNTSMFTSLIENVYNLAKFTFGEKVIKRLKLYQMFLTVRDKKYLDWSIEKIILWDRKKADSNVVHIHGDADEVFPIKYIQDCIVVKGGTHIMILTKYKWINVNLPKIIIEK